MKYAVKVPFYGDMIYVTEGDSKFQLRVKVFNSRERAQEIADLWGKESLVVEYQERDQEDEK